MISLDKSQWGVYFVIHPFRRSFRRLPVLFEWVPVALLCLMQIPFNWALQHMHQFAITESGDTKFFAAYTLHLGIYFVMHLSHTVCICLLSTWCFCDLGCNWYLDGQCTCGNIIPACRPDHRSWRPRDRRFRRRSRRFGIANRGSGILSCPVVAICLKLAIPFLVFASTGPRAWVGS